MNYISLMCDSTAPGLLIFAQCLDELLFDYSLDTFKAPALNLHISVLEVKSLLTRLVDGRLSVSAVKHAVDELEYHLRTDPVPLRPLPMPWRACFDRMKDLQSEPRKMLNQSGALLIEIDSCYWSLLKSKLLTKVGEPKCKREITALARVFATEVELRGFTRRYTYFENQGFFFNAEHSPEKIDSVNQLGDFLNRFEREPRERMVVFRGSKDFISFSDFSSPFRLEISDRAPSVDSKGFRTERFLGSSTEFPLYITAKDIHVCDEHGARDHARMHIETFTDVCRFAGHTADMRVSDSCLVVDKERKYTNVVPSPKNPMFCHYGGTKRERESTVTKAIEILSGRHFSPAMRDSFRRVLDYHEAALGARTRENQLLNLWSALEGFLPAPEGKKSRIEYYIANLVPALTITYPERLFKYVADALCHVTDEIRSLIDSVSVHGTTTDKVLALLSCDELDSERQSLCQLLDIDPFLRFRCFWFYSNFSNNESILQLLEKHQQRLKWHIRRIYSARNQIAHSASSLPYLPTLVENLHCYIDTLVETIVAVGVASDLPTQMGEVLALLDAHALALITRLSGKKVSCTLETHRAMILGEKPLLRELE